MDDFGNSIETFGQTAAVCGSSVWEVMDVCIVSVATYGGEYATQLDADRADI